MDVSGGGALRLDGREGQNDQAEHFLYPGWAGHLVMAYAFLKAMGLDGDIGMFIIDLRDQTATASSGHAVKSFTLICYPCRRRKPCRTWKMF